MSLVECNIWIGSRNGAQANNIELATNITRYRKGNEYYFLIYPTTEINQYQHISIINYDDLETVSLSVNLVPDPYYNEAGAIAGDIIINTSDISYDYTCGGGLGNGIQANYIMNMIPTKNDFTGQGFLKDMYFESLKEVLYVNEEVPQISYGGYEMSWTEDILSSTVVYDRFNRQYTFKAKVQPQPFAYTGSCP